MLGIRRVSIADIDSLVPLKALLHELHVARRPDVFKAMEPAGVAAWLRDQLEDDSLQGWIAEEDSTPLAYLLAGRQRRDETHFSMAREWYEIDEVVVDPAYRRQGVARALIERAVVQAHRLGLETVQLSAWSFNESARAAFERVGFTPMAGRYELSASSLE